MYNRVQQRFDKSIRDAVEDTKRANERKPRRALKPLPDEPRRAKGRMVLLMDPETGGTVLVPYNHPLAEAKRRQKRANADTLSQEPCAPLDGGNQRKDEDYERRNDMLNHLSGPGIRKT